MRLIVDQSLAAGFIAINTLEQRASLPFKPCVLERNMSQSTDRRQITGRRLHLHQYSRQQRASLSFRPCALERNVSQCG